MNIYDKHIYIVKRITKKLKNNKPKKNKNKNKKIYEKKFMREAYHLMQLNHPHVVRCYSWWLEHSNEENTVFLYLQLEFVGDLNSTSRSLNNFTITYLE